ncbi:hypothetical protein KSP40_PGU000811 [Platanthera guangdongensis]|uniref:RING-type E3 ubiquitin transferase n=1 Tax=Platanthera guangdongensis TaxID=2320717 RepID=A0ABR2MKQ2_9ASPA
MEGVSASPSKKRKGHKHVAKDEEITVKIDPQLLHCGICADPLDNDGLVFQCANGHVLCSACAAKYGESCPDCLTADVSRCVALETIVDRLRMPCPFSAFGCMEFVSRAEKHSHELYCAHAPLACLVPGCLWSGPQDCISDHIRVDHGRLCGSQGFFYNKKFSIQVRCDGLVHLLKGKDGSIFALLVTNALPAGSMPGGSMLRVVRVQRGSAIGTIFEYDLEVKRGRSSMTLKSVPDDWGHHPSAPVAQQQESLPELLFVPRHFTGGTTINVDLRIRKI